jgi:hypothetical protein
MLSQDHFTINTSLAAAMVRWFEGGVNQGLLPMTISDEESTCHLLKCYEVMKKVHAIY